MHKNYYNQYKPSDEIIEMTYNLMFTTKGEIPYLELSSFNQDNYRGIILSSKSNPEKDYSKREAFQKLSDEAKEVVETILDAPLEITELITTSVFGLYSKTLIRKYFLKKGWKNQNVEKVFKELSTFISHLE